MKNPLRSAILVLNLFCAIVIAASVGAQYTPIIGALAGAGAFTIVSALLTPREGACYANNFGVLTNTILVHDAFSLFLTELFPLRDMVLDVGADGSRAVKPGDTITVKDWRFEVEPYEVQSATGYNQPSDITAGGVPVQMPNKPWAVSVVLTPEEYRLLASGKTGGADYQVFKDKVREIMSNSLGRLLIAKWFELITEENYPNEFVTAAGTFNRAVEIDLDTKFFTRKVSPRGTNGILHPTTFGEWTKDHIAIQTNTGENRQKTVLLSGRRESQNSNFTFWRTNVPLPEDAPRGFVSSRSHAIGAFRIPDEPTFENDPVSLNEVVDSETKISMLNRLWKNAQTGAIQMDLAVIFKYVKGQEEALERLVPAA